MLICSVRFIIRKSTKPISKMNIRLEPKEITDAYSTPIVQQTSFWSKVKEQLGINSYVFYVSIQVIL